jgi:N-acetylglucosamine-6-phosphate deacetylase
MQIFARHYRTLEPLSIDIAGTRIDRVDPAWSANMAAWPVVAPALFDLQINGHGGIWFGGPSITADDVIKTLAPHFRFGISRLCPTLITNSFAALANGFAAIREACERHEWVNGMVPGCHLEGPYIASEDGPRGAHPLEHVRPADWREFEQLQEASGQRIRLVTLAPEVDGAIDFIRRAVQAGVVISIGHTGADPDTVRAAVDAGARLSTHLGNGAHGMLRRHPNYIWEQLGDSRLSASVISDGYHLPASVLQTIIRTKGEMSTILTCDAAGLAGCPPGVYHEGSVDVEVLQDGRIVIAGQRQLLAGSSVETDTCVREAVRIGGVSLATAIDMASRNPARLLGFEEVRLRRGSLADLVVFRFDEAGGMQVQATIGNGELRYGQLSDHAA